MAELLVLYIFCGLPFLLYLMNMIGAKYEELNRAATPGQVSVVWCMIFIWPLTLVVFMGMVIFCRKEVCDEP